MVNFDEIIFSYSPFKIFKVFKVISINNFLLQNLVVGLLFIFAFIASAFFEGTLILPGKDIGLFEHPSIWIFLVLQILLPFSQSKILKIFDEMPHWENQIIQNKYFTEKHQIITENLVNDLSLKSPRSRAIFRIFVFAGLVLFVWNSYQNQYPLKFLGFDFWDSINHTSSYWITRIFKLYIWGLLFPFCLFSQLMITRKMLKEVKDASKSNQIVINPFHSCYLGGFNQFIVRIISPLWPFFIVSGLHALVVIIIHGKLDYTPLIGIIIFILIILFVYLFPVINIRKIIIQEKRKKLDEINDKRNEILNSLDFKISSENISITSDLLKNLKYIKESYEEISNWPGHQYFNKVIGLSYSPAIITLLIKFISQFVIRS